MRSSTCPRRSAAGTSPACPVPSRPPTARPPHRGQGARQGATTITVTRNEILYGLNQADKFIMAVVLADGDSVEGPFYILDAPSPRSRIGPSPASIWISMNCLAGVRPHALEQDHAEQFRCFERLELDLHPRLTVLVGENGAGKTAVLDAIAGALSPVLTYLSSANQRLTGRGIQDADFRVVQWPQFGGKARWGMADVTQLKWKPLMV